MTFAISTRLLFAVVGLALYVAPVGPKWNEVGRIMFFVGLFAIVVGGES
jgi:hypothetical protein